MTPLNPLLALFEGLFVWRGWNVSDPIRTRIVKGFLNHLRIASGTKVPLYPFFWQWRYRSHGLIEMGFQNETIVRGVDRQTLDKNKKGLADASPLRMINFLAIRVEL
jgi:hypothetical protein